MSNRWQAVERAGRVEPQLQSDGSVRVVFELTGTVLPEWKSIFDQTRAMLTARSKFERRVPSAISVQFMPDELERVIQEVDSRVKRANETFEETALPHLIERWSKESRDRSAQVELQQDLLDRAKQYDKPPPSNDDL